MQHYIIFHFEAFKLDEICFGCPLEGSDEALTADTVLRFVHKELNDTAFKSGLITNHLGLDKIKKYIAKPTTYGGKYSREIKTFRCWIFFLLF